MENIYKAKKLGFRYRKKKIIEEVSFSVKKGDIVGLLGPNGAGKSTLVNLLTGVLDDYTGEIHFGPSPVRGNEIEVKSNISAILDRSATYDNITVEQNVAYYGQLFGTPAPEREGLLEAFELTGYRRYKVWQMSSGFKQRLKIVIALLNSPSVIFLDEPWLALDPINSQFLTDKITELNRTRGITFIIAAHDLNELDQLCTRFLFIDSGQLLLDFPKSDRTEFDVVFVKDGTIGRDRFANLNYFMDSKSGQYVLLNPSEDELSGLHQTDRKKYTLKDLYFRVLT